MNPNAAYKTLLDPIVPDIKKLIEEEKLLFDSMLAMTKLRDRIDIYKNKIIEYFDALNDKLDTKIETIEIGGRKIIIRRLTSKKTASKVKVLKICKEILDPEDFKNLENMLKAEESVNQRMALSVERTQEEKEKRKLLMLERKSKT